MPKYRIKGQVWNFSEEPTDEQLQEVADSITTVQKPIPEVQPALKPVKPSKLENFIGETVSRAFPLTYAAETISRAFPKAEEPLLRGTAQVGAGALEAVPGMKRLFPEQAKMYEKIPPQNMAEYALRGAGSVAASAPLFGAAKGAAVLSKLPGVLKTASAMGALSAADTAAENIGKEPLMQTARKTLESGISGAGTGTVMHVLGRAGATILPKQWFGAERVGSGLGGVLSGLITSGGSPEEAVFQGGLNLLYPSRRLNIDGLNKPFIRLGRTLAKEGARISESSLDTVNRLGMKAVDRTALDKVNVIKNMESKARDNILNNIIGGKKTDPRILDQLGFTPDDIAALKEISPAKLEELRKLPTGSEYDLQTKLNESRIAAGEKINSILNKAKQKGARVDLSPVMGQLKSELFRRKIIDRNGNFTAEGEYVLKGGDRAIRGLAELWRGQREVRQPKWGYANVQEYRNTLEKIDSLIGVEPKKDYILVGMRKRLIESAEKAIPGLKELNKSYRENILLGNLAPKVNAAVVGLPEKLENQLSKMSKAEKVLFREKNKDLYGAEFLDNVDLLAAAKEIYPERGQGLTNLLGRKIYTGYEKAKESLPKSQFTLKGNILPKTRPEQPSKGVPGGMRKGQLLLPGGESPKGSKIKFESLNPDTVEFVNKLPEGGTASSIPYIKGTAEANEYGKTIVGNKAQIRAITERMQENLAKITAGKKTKGDWSKVYPLIHENHMLREVIEAATNTGSYKTMEESLKSQSFGKMLKEKLNEGEQLK